MASGPLTFLPVMPKPCGQLVGSGNASALCSPTGLLPTMDSTPSAYVTSGHLPACNLVLVTFFQPLGSSVFLAEAQGLLPGLFSLTDAVPSALSFRRSSLTHPTARLSAALPHNPLVHHPTTSHQ